MLKNITDGSSWTEVNDVNKAGRSEGGGSGTQAAAIFAGTTELILLVEMKQSFGTVQLLGLKLII